MSDYLGKIDLEKMMAHGFDLFNVFTSDSSYTKNGVTFSNKAKTPCRKGEMGSMLAFKGWEKATHDELEAAIAFDARGFGLRLGNQTNGLRILSLDFDICGEKDCDGKRVGCSKTEELWKHFRLGVGRDDGIFTSSTDGNWNVLIDYTQCSDIATLVDQIMIAKISKHHLEILLAKNQVIPPTATICKKTNALGKPRAFLNNMPFCIMLPENDFVHEFVPKLLSEYLEENKSARKFVKKSVHSVPLPVSESKIAVHDDKWTSLLYDVIGTKKKDLDWKRWFGTFAVLENNGYSKQFYLDWANRVDLSCSKRDKPDVLWDKNAGKNAPNKYPMYALQAFAKEINIDKYNIWFAANNYSWPQSSEEDRKISDHALEEIRRLDPFRNPFSSGLVADIFKILYEKEFKFCNGIMYHFNEIYWKPDDKALSFLHNFVDKRFVQALVAFCDWERPKFTGQLADPDKNVADAAKAMIVKINTFSDRVFELRRIKYRKDHIQDICHRLTDNEIQWNKNPYHFAFENVIFDLKTSERVVPNSADFVNTTCGYDYDFFYDSDQKVAELQAIIDTILPDREVQNYYLEILASGMCGIQVQKVFIATGKGGNGKSLINGLALHTFGKYCYTLPSSVLGQKIKDGANPEVANMNGKRLVFGNEPDQGSTLCCSTLKAITGDAELGVRQCFSNDTKILLKCTLVIACNDKPLLDEVNDAMTRRMNGAIIPFHSSFTSQVEVDRCSAENDGVKPDNVHLAREYYVTEEFKADYKQALFSLLLLKFNGYMTNQINNIPAIVSRMSRDYMAGSDNIYDWFLEHYEKDSESMVLVDDVFNEYKISQKFIQMTKNEKRLYASIGKFKEKLESNLFIARYYRLRGKYWNGQSMRVPFIEGWREIAPQNDTPENV